MPGAAPWFTGTCVVASLIPAWCRDPPAERELVAAPGLVRTWGGRLTADGAADRAAAATALVRAGAAVLPLLRRLLADPDESLRQETFEIIRHIGPGPFRC